MGVVAVAVRVGRGSASVSSASMKGGEIGVRICGWPHGCRVRGTRCSYMTVRIRCRTRCHRHKGQRPLALLAPLAPLAPLERVRWYQA